MLSPDAIDWLRRGWFRLLGRFGVGPDAAESVLNSLIAAYSAPDRFYHDLEHLHEMLHIARRLAGDAAVSAEVDLAIWLHDAVYDTRSKDSEDRSAELALTSLRPVGLPPASLDRAAALIRATAHLSASAPPQDRATAILLDADLAVLGAPEERYRRYAADIRREYAWAPEEDYRKGRAKVLETFLARPRIYWTELTHQEQDAQARRNMRDELHSLSSAGGRNL